MIHYTPEDRDEDGTIWPALYRVVSRGKEVIEVRADKVVFATPLDQKQAFAELAEILEEQPEPGNGSKSVSASS